MRTHTCKDAGGVTVVVTLSACLEGLKVGEEQSALWLEIEV